MSRFTTYKYIKDLPIVKQKIDKTANFPYKK